MEQTMSNAAAPTVRWSLHASGKWHGFRDGGAASICGYTRLINATCDNPPEDGTACRLCLAALNIGEAPTVARRQTDHTRRETVLVEVLGGALDGVRLELDIVRDGRGALRVLENNYHERGAR